MKQAALDKTKSAQLLAAIHTEVCLETAAYIASVIWQACPAT